MKKIFLILITSIGLFSCNVNDDLYIVEKHEKRIVEKVEYHSIGSDNTLQTTPYWKIRFEGESTPIRTNRKYKVGDTVDVVVKIIKEKNTK